MGALLRCRGMPDLVSWLVIERGWRVVRPDGDEIGQVEDVVGDSGMGIFNGLAVRHNALTRVRYVPAERVQAIYEGVVALDVHDLDEFEEYDEPPASERFDSETGASARNVLSTSKLHRTAGLAASPGTARILAVVTDHAVVIAGGGPTGLMLAAELALADVEAAIVERRASKALAGSRAGGLHARTLEVLDQRGVAERFVSEGQTYPVAGFAMNTLDITDFPTRHNHVLGLTQNHIERIMAGWIGELGVSIYRG